MSNVFDRNTKIFVAGHRGLAGSAIVRQLRARGYQNLLMKSRAELDLLDRQRVMEMFSAEKPQAVVIAAAKVGGILANSKFPADFLTENLRIQDNIIGSAFANGVTRLVFLGSSCIYPRDCAQPIREDALLTSQLEPTNRAYAIAKITGVEACWAYNRQHGTGYLALMPTNLYGPGDNYDLENSHVLPALLRKVHTAKVNGASEVVVWGTGSPRREFLFSEDLGAACAFALELPDELYLPIVRNEKEPPLLNVGWGKDIVLRELAEMICEVVGYKGALKFDTSKPDGTPRKLLDTSRIQALGWKPLVGLQEGLQQTYMAFLHEHQELTAKV